MGYSLGIDLGATTCAAALRRHDAPEPFVLGESTTTMPAVALPRADGSALVGEAADVRSPYEPTLVARMVAARLGRPEPIVIDGVPCDPLGLTEALVGTAVDRAALSLGERPDHVVLAYPLRPDDQAETLLTEAGGRIAGHTTTMVPAPVAAVAKLARDRDLGDDTTVAVVDFGGATVDVTLVHRTATAFDLVGEPTSLPELGGTDLDAVVLTLVESAIGDITSTVRTQDHAAMTALRRVRASCRAAKERLSTGHTAVVDVALPHARGRVEITREAFERAVEAPLTDAVELVLSTIADAGLIPADVNLALLTGGSAHIPRFADLVTERTGLAVVTDDAPELTVALGAALFADVAPGAAGSIAAAGAVGAAAAAVGAAAAGAALSGPALLGRPEDVVPGGDLDAPGVGTPGLFDTGSLPEVREPGPLDSAPPGLFEDTGSVPAAFDTGPLGTAPPGPFDTAPPNPFDTGAGAFDTGAAAWAAPSPAEAWNADGALPPGERTLDDPWGHEPAAAFDPGDRWEDTRTSVFDQPPPAVTGATSFAPGSNGPGSNGPGGNGADDFDDWEPPPPPGDEFQRLRTSDTDPFGTRAGTLTARLRERADDQELDHDGASFDARLVVGGVVAAVVVVLIAGYALLSGTGGTDDPAIAVAETPATTERTTTTPPSSTTTVATTTTEATTTTTEEPTTTTRPRPRPRPTTPTTEAPPPAPPPSPPPPPPTTATPTTRPTTTTTASTTTTTTTEDDDEGERPG